MSPGLVSVLNSLILVPMPAELAYAYSKGPFTYYIRSERGWGGSGEILLRASISKNIRAKNRIKEKRGWGV